MARILVGLHHLELGGSQLNALDLAVAMTERGHQPVLFGVHPGDRPGPLADLVRSRGLPMVLVRHPLERTRRLMPYRPRVARAMARAVREHQIDLVHCYEYPLILDACYGPHLRLGTPMCGTVYTMTVPRWLPRYPPLVLGTAALVAQAAAYRDHPVLIEPPVNTDVDDPALVDGADLRAHYGVSAGELLLTLVSRLEPEMKAEGVIRTMAALELLEGEAPGRLRLLVAGGGPSIAELSERASKTNAALGRDAVIMAGELRDPRPAYAAADINLGMGGSALRAMSYGKPLIVLGTGGFSRPLRSGTVEDFLRDGFYGVGAGDLDATPLAAQIRELAADPALRRRDGELARALVLDRFSLKSAAARLDEVYQSLTGTRTPAGRRVSEALRSAAYRAAADAVSDEMRDRIRPLLRRGGAR